MVYYITDSISYLTHGNQVTKEKSKALKFSSEAEAGRTYANFLSMLPPKAKKKWRIDPRNEDGIYCIQCERGYLSSDMALTTAPNMSGRWEKKKAENILKNDCANRTILRKYQWTLVPEEEVFPGEYEFQNIEISFTGIDPENYSAASLDSLFPFSGGCQVNNSFDLVHAVSCFCNGIEERRSRLMEERDKANQQVQVIEHAIEFNTYDSETDEKLVRLIRNVRQRRRRCKDELVVLNAFLNCLTPEDAEQMESDIQILKGRYYTPQAFPELFQESDNVIIPRTLTDTCYSVPPDATDMPDTGTDERTDKETHEELL